MQFHYIGYKVISYHIDTICKKTLHYNYYVIDSSVTVSFKN